VAKLLFAVAVLVACVSYVEPKPLAAALASIPLWALLFALVTNVAATIIMPAAISMIALQIERISFGFWQMVELNFATRFYILILPRPVAVGVRWVRYRRRGSGDDAAALIVFERVVQTLVIAGTAMVFLAAERTHLAAGGGYLLAATGILTAVLVLLFGMFLSPTLASIARRVRRTLARPFPAAVRRRIDRLLDAVTAFSGLPSRSIVAIVVLSVAGYAGFVLSAYVLIAAMQLPLGVMAVAWIRSVVFLLTLLPISIGGIGVREASNVVLLQLYGVDSASALAFSFGLLSIQLAVGAIGGAFEGLRYVQKLRARRR
jgi:glycosyltransferase 2 family protein